MVLFQVFLCLPLHGSILTKQLFGVPIMTCACCLALQSQLMANVHVLYVVNFLLLCLSSPSFLLPPFNSMYVACKQDHCMILYSAI